MIHERELAYADEYRAGQAENADGGAHRAQTSLTRAKHVRRGKRAADRMTSRTWNDTIQHVTTYEYDENGNRKKIIHEDGQSMTSEITATYDRLNRPLTVSVTGDTPATTTYSYDLGSPSWTDPSGNYTAILDAFDRQVSLTDPL